MEEISDLKIVGIDELRPPKILKEPYINLYFKLNHKAPTDWCKEFNTLTRNRKFSAKIDPQKGLMIDTWVRTANEVEENFEYLKAAVKQCAKEYVERIEAETKANSSQSTDQSVSAEQMELNQVIAGLKYDA